ncbi:MAG: hypothetical protein ACOX1G_08270 [bacterium]
MAQAETAILLLSGGARQVDSLAVSIWKIGLAREERAAMKHLCSGSCEAGAWCRDQAV